VVSLSGGLDSRAVAGGLYRSRVPFQAITFMDHRKTAQKDLDLAKIVAGLLRIPWTRIDLNPPSGGNAYRLFASKLGMNYLSMRFIISYFEEILSRFGSKIPYYTGNTGMCIRSYTPSRKLSNPEDVVRYLFSRGGKYLYVAAFSFDEVANLTEIKKEDIFGEVVSEIASYPEHSANYKYMHYMFSEYCFNSHYEGIDMQRGFLWQSTPLEATPFFLYAVGCPDVQKMNFLMYREFINKLTPETAVVNNASWNAPINSRKALGIFILRSYYNRLPSSVKGTVRALFRTIPCYEKHSPIIQTIKEQMISCPEIAGFLSLPALEKTLMSSVRIKIDTLLGITSLIEKISGRNSTLLNHLDDTFE
jgi:asparagine synthase (glutamine-hydrolysing)